VSGKPVQKLFSETAPQNPKKQGKNGYCTAFFYIMAFSIFTLNIEMRTAYYRRNATSFQENPVFSRASRIKTMQQVSNILGILETILKNIPRKPVFSRGLKKIKKSYKKVLNF
jgi:hypothetical protein